MRKSLLISLLIQVSVLCFSQKVQDTFGGCKFGINKELAKSILRSKGLQIQDEINYYAEGSKCHQGRFMLDNVNFIGFRFYRAYFFFFCEHFNKCTYRSKFDNMDAAGKTYAGILSSLERIYGKFDVSGDMSFISMEYYEYHDRFGNNITFWLKKAATRSYELSLSFTTPAFDSLENTE